MRTVVGVEGHSSGQREVRTAPSPVSWASCLRRQGRCGQCDGCAREWWYRPLSPFSLVEDSAVSSASVSCITVFHILIVSDFGDAHLSLLLLDFCTTSCLADSSGQCRSLLNYPVFYPYSINFLAIFCLLPLIGENLDC